jgi:hypothetical protein
MVVNLLESLVLHGVSVLGDGQAVGLRLGSQEGPLQAKAIPVSFLRHRSHTGLVTAEPFIPGNYPPGNRAGRPGSCADVLASRSSAPGAGRIDQRQSKVEGGPERLAAIWCCSTRAKPVAPRADMASLATVSTRGRGY